MFKYYVGIHVPLLYTLSVHTCNSVVLSNYNTLSPTSTFRHETTSLRSELSQRHSEEQRVALRELAGLQDTALKQAQERWEGERRKLFDQVTIYILMYKNDIILCCTPRPL